MTQDDKPIHPELERLIPGCSCGHCTYEKLDRQIHEAERRYHDQRIAQLMRLPVLPYGKKTGHEAEMEAALDTIRRLEAINKHLTNVLFDQARFSLPPPILVSKEAWLRAKAEQEDGCDVRAGADWKPEPFPIYPESVQAEYNRRALFIESFKPLTEIPTPRDSWTDDGLIPVEEQKRRHIGPFNPATCGSTGAFTNVWRRLRSKIEVLLRAGQTMEQWIKLAMMYLFISVVLVTGLLSFGLILVSLGLWTAVTTTRNIIRRSKIFR